MAALRMPHPLREHPDATRTARDTFWAVALGIIAAYTFFYALGAFSPGDVTVVSIVVAILVGAWALRVWTTARHEREGRDPRLSKARERRGF